MTVGIGEFTFAVVTKLIANLISAGTKHASLPFFERRKIDRRVEEATAEVVEPLVHFLSQEGLTEAQQHLLVETCVNELQPITSDPRPLFEGSLDGQKIFDRMYADRKLPQAVRDEDIENVYALLFVRIATLLCRIPAAVKDWESHAWAENYRKLDDIASELKRLFEKVDALQVSSAAYLGDPKLPILRKALAQRVGLELDLTGLRADKPLAGKFEDLFVHPELTTMIANEKVSVGSAADAAARFLKERQCGIVVGGPGSGKSTWSRWLQREVLTDAWTALPIRVELRALNTQSLPSMHDLIRDSVSTHLKEDVTHERMQEWVDKQALVFILDGFDEIRPDARDDVATWISELHIATGNCLIVITSRPLTTEHLDKFPKEWARWNIEPFDEPRIVDYIRRWYAHAPLLVGSDRNVSAEALVQGWRSDPIVGPLTVNPLLLSTLLMVHHLDGSLPSGRAQLYRRYVDGMLGLWDSRRQVAGANVPLETPDKRRILRALSLHLQFEEKEQLEEAEAIAVVQTALDKLGKKCDAQKVLEVLRERSGLLVGPGIYNFVHKSVGEFLVAEAVVEGDDRDPSGNRIDRLLLFKHRGDDKWNTVTFLWAGLAPFADVETFAQECINVGDIPLAWGILWDQYKRFSRDARRRQLLQGFGTNADRLFSDNSSFGTDSGGPRETFEARRKLNVPMMSLRGIQDCWVYHLLFRAVRDGTILWCDAKDAQGLLRDFMWFSVVFPCRDIDDWAECIKAPPPAGAPADVWRHWIAEHLMNLVVAVKDPSRGLKFLDAYVVAFPHLAGWLPLALMSAALQDALLREEDQRSISEIAVSAKKALVSIRCHDVPSDFLGTTNHWFLHRMSGKDIDLLREFASLIESHAKECGPDGGLHRETLDYVNSLIARRDK